MKLLFTGASGFLGSNLYSLLKDKYQIRTVGLTPRDNYTINLVSDVPKLNIKYDVVLHAAGKAHSIPKTEEEKQLFFDVNLQGTKNLCTALENSGIPKAFIFISTVAVYGCDSGENITEEHPLNGTTPYALSKICLLYTSYSEEISNAIYLSFSAASYFCKGYINEKHKV